MFISYVRLKLVLNYLPDIRTGSNKDNLRANAFLILKLNARFIKLEYIFFRLIF